MVASSSERERRLAAWREAYANAAARPIPGELGRQWLSFLATLIELSENGWDERSRQAIAKGKQPPLG